MIRDYVCIRKTWAKISIGQIEKIFKILKKYILKQEFRRDKKLQENVILLFNL